MALLKCCSRIAALALFALAVRAQPVAAQVATMPRVKTADGVLTTPAVGVVLLNTDGSAAAGTEAATAVVSSGAAAGAILKVGAGALVSVNPVNGGTAGYAVVYDAAAVPADGALTASQGRLILPFGHRLRALHLQHQRRLLVSNRMRMVA